MTYSCSDFTDDILRALNIDVPEESYDSPSDQADMAIAEIEALRKNKDFRDEVLDAIGPTGWCGDSISDDIGAQADSVCAGIIKANDAARALFAALERLTTVADGCGWIRRPGDAIEQAYDALIKAKMSGITKR